MPVTIDEWNAFREFAEARIASQGSDSLQELIDAWDADHPSPEQHSQDFKAVRAAIRDMNDGDTGQPAAHVLQQLRKELSGLQG